MVVLVLVLVLLMATTVGLVVLVGAARGMGIQNTLTMPVVQQSIASPVVVVTSALVGTFAQPAPGGARMLSATKGGRGIRMASARQEKPR